MKRLLTVLPLILLLTGCGSLIPHQVEFFQRKVHVVPTYSPAVIETQKEAAKEIDNKLQAALDAALSEHSSSNVVTPLQDAKTVSSALSTSLGPPKYQPSTAPTAPQDIATTLTKDRAKLDVAIADYAKTTDKDAGKKIDGTGLIHMSYFTYIGCILLFGVLIWFAIRLYGLFNPVVGTAAGVVGRVSSSVVSTGFGELVSGGQQFLQWVENSSLETDVKNWVTNAFSLAHQTAQSPATQAVVNKLIETPTTSSAPLNPAPASAPTAAEPATPA